jgi:hypothetical protein
MRPTRERTVETAMVKYAISKGFIVFKWESKGVPDRLFFKGGRCFIAEVKSPTGRLSKKQEVVIRKLREKGMVVEVPYSKEEAKRIIDEWSEYEDISDS